MTRPKKAAPAWANQWLHQVAYTGRPNERLAGEAAARGWRVSPATIGRRLHEIRGSRRSGKNGWTPPGARAPVAAIAQPVAETKRLVSLLSEGAPESEPDFIASLFSAQAEALDDPTVEAERQRLSAALSDAESHDEMSAIELEIAMLDPVVAHYLAAGDSRVLALSIAGHSPLILSRPEDLAELASLVTYGPELEQEEGESDEDFARCIGCLLYTSDAADE